MKEDQTQDNLNLAASFYTNPNQPKPKKKLTPVTIVALILSVILLGSIIFLNIRIHTIQKNQEITDKLKNSIILDDNTGVIIQTPTPEEQKKNKEIGDLYALMPIYQPTFHVEFSYSDNKYHIIPFGDNSSNYQEDFNNWLDKQGFTNLPGDIFIFENK